MFSTPFPHTLVAFALLSVTAASAGAQGSPAAPVAEAVSIDRAPGQLVGTLLVPHAAGPIPIVLLISGSGPTDRDGSTPALGVNPASLRQLAESLATRGIATLRYDKRGIAGSASAATSEAQLRFETYAGDAAAWIRFLQSDHRFSHVIVAGHSEGALLGLLAMQETPAAAYISLEGPARPADQVLHDQLVTKLPPAMMTQSDTILARLKRGETVDSTPPALAALFRPSVQPYLISWFRHSAAAEIARLTVPCLIVQGTYDGQVAPAEANLLHAANPHCQVAMIPDMNHVLKLTSTADLADQLSTYRTPDAPLAPGLVDAVARFVHSIR